jgi:RNA polymerase-binding transcription factor DksA
MALTQQQTQKLHTAIEQRREALLSELREDVERVRRDRHEELAGAAPDAGDESVATLIADLDHAEVDRDLNELRDLEAARSRLAEGSYGVCADLRRRRRLRAAEGESGGGALHRVPDAAREDLRHRQRLKPLMNIGVRADFPQL